MSRLDAQLRFDLSRCLARAGGTDIHHISQVNHWFEWDDGSSPAADFERACRFVRMYASGMALKEACEKSGYQIAGVWPCDEQSLKSDRRRAG